MERSTDVNAGAGNMPPGDPTDRRDDGEASVLARIDEEQERLENEEARRAVCGDEASIASLWRRHRRWVAAVLLAHKPRWADLDDLLQEVALSLVRKIGELRDPDAVRPWLRTVAINAAHAAGRSGSRRAADVGLEESLPGHSPALETGVDPDAREQGRRLMDLALTLPDGYREPLLLKAVHGLSYREIGRIMGLPETTVETRIARGRRQLRALAAEAGIGV